MKDCPDGRLTLEVSYLIAQKAAWQYRQLSDCPDGRLQLGISYVIVQMDAEKNR